MGSRVHSGFIFLFAIAVVLSGCNGFAGGADSTDSTKTTPTTETVHDSKQPAGSQAPSTQTTPYTSGPESTPTPSTQTSTKTASFPTTTTTPTATPVQYDNPWGKRNVTVAVKGNEEIKKSYSEEIKQAIQYWSFDRVSRFTSYEFDLQYNMDNDGETADITVELEPDISSCSYSIELAGYFGCAPLGVSDGTDQVEIQIDNTQPSTLFRNTLIHELGHVFGIEHGESPVWVMGNGTISTDIENAADRSQPFNHSRTVRVSAKDLDYETSGIRAAISTYRKTMKSDIEYVEDWRRADIIFVDENPQQFAVSIEPGSWSQAHVYGVDYDDDDALEKYSAVYVQLHEVDDVEYHAGYWIGKMVINTNENDLPSEYQG